MQKFYRLQKYTFFFFLHYYPDSSRSSNILCIISRLSCLIDRGNTLCTEFEDFPVSSDMLLRLMSLIITNIFTTKSSIYQNVAKSTKITFFFFFNFLFINFSAKYLPTQTQTDAHTDTQMPTSNYNLQKQILNLYNILLILPSFFLTRLKLFMFKSSKLIRASYMNKLIFEK